MTTSNNDATSEFTGTDVTSRYPELDVTSTLPTTPEPTLEMPSTDPLAIFREEEGRGHCIWESHSLRSGVHG